MRKAAEGILSEPSIIVTYIIAKIIGGCQAHTPRSVLLMQQLNQKHIDNRAGEDAQE